MPNSRAFARTTAPDTTGAIPARCRETSAQIVKEPHALLQNAGETPPYVLVGHSYGGTNVRIYNWHYPGEVAGMVLADTGHEDMKSPPGLSKIVDAGLVQRQEDRKSAPLLYRFGFSRFRARDKIDGPNLPYEQKERWYFDIHPKFIAAETSELENLDDGKQDLRLAGNLGNKPLILQIARESLLDLPLSVEERTSLNQSWVDFEMRLAKLSSRGRWVMLSNTGHMIPFERPDSIVSAVQEVCADIKSQ